MLFGRHLPWNVLNSRHYCFVFDQDKKKRDSSNPLKLYHMGASQQILDPQISVLLWGIAVPVNLLLGSIDYVYVNCWLFLFALWQIWARICISRAVHYLNELKVCK
jgi:hypothetical protein